MLPVTARQKLVRAGVYNKQAIDAVIRVAALLKPLLQRWRPLQEIFCDAVTQQLPREFSLLRVPRPYSTEAWRYICSQPRWEIHSGIRCLAWHLREYEHSDTVWNILQIPELFLDDTLAEIKRVDALVREALAQQRDRIMERTPRSEKTQMQNAINTALALPPL